MSSNTFAVTGMGRSGTQFLAHTLNQSDLWTVKHEPDGYMDERVFLRFENAQYYGEVNSYLRHVIAELPVEKKAVILRDPREIVVSAYNRWGCINEYSRKLLAEGFKSVSNAVDSGIRPISFRRMTTDKRYLFEVIQWLGVYDVPMQLIDPTPVDATKVRRIAGFYELPDEVFSWFSYEIGRYRDEWSGLF